MTSRRPGLDPIVSDTINRLIRRLQSHLHVTSIVVTHDMISTNHIADRVALLRSGQIHFEGTLAEFARLDGSRHQGLHRRTIPHEID